MRRETERQGKRMEALTRSMHILTWVGVGVAVVGAVLTAITLLSGASAPARRSRTGEHAHGPGPTGSVPDRGRRDLTRSEASKQMFSPDEGPRIALPEVATWHTKIAHLGDAPSTPCLLP